MKILQINSFFSAGGPPRIVKGIYDTVVRNGDECLVAAARDTPLPSMNSYRIGNPLTSYACAMQSRLLDNDGFAAKGATKQFIRKIEDFNPDIIHIHNLHGYYINIIELFNFLKAAGKPVVWTMHDCWAITGHCPHFTMVKCDRYLTGCHHCPQKKDYPASYIKDASRQNWIQKKATFSCVPNMTIVCVSEWLEGIVKRSYLSEYPTKVIYNGVDLLPFQRIESDFRKQRQLQDKRLLLGVAMHWVKRKGLYDFIKLADLLDDRYRVVLVGELNEKDIPANIIHIPPTKGDGELAEIYSACDLCLNLSYEETFGLTTVESLACGTPVITYDQTAVPEISRKFGMPVVHAGNIEELRKSIEAFFDEGKHSGSANYNVSVFEQERQYQKYFQLYKKLVDL